MDKNDDSNLNYLIQEYKQVINIFKTLSDSSVKKYEDVFHFAIHYLTDYFEEVHTSYSTQYKKIAAEADKQVQI